MGSTHNALLLTLGELVRKEISAPALLHRIVDVMAEVLGADRGTVFVLDDETDELVAVAAHLPEMTTLRVPRSQGVAGYVARTARVVNIPHCADDERIWRAVDARTGYHTRTMLAGPLHDQAGNLIGVAQFLNKKRAATPGADTAGDVFTEQDEATFEVLRDQVARLLEATTLGSGRDFLPPTGSSVVPQGPPEEAPLPLGDRINGLVGSSAAMRRVYRNIHRVAPTEATVMLRGESGTGKGLVARALHHNSGRRDGPFVHVDCTTLPDGLMENELFGHERGAYTGADARTSGKVEQARGGTLFLDELGDLPLALQGKLLTLVQDRHYHRVGGTEQIAADIRIVAATNRDLESLVADGRFREDLYYRLRVVELELPPLRERGDDDLRLLINHFVGQAARRHHRTVHGIAPDALSALLACRWPGNVRELQHCLESAVIFCEGGEITRADLPFGASSPTPRAAETPPAAGAPRDPRVFEDEPTLYELERRYIAWLLEQHDGNRSACARALGIGRNTLLRKIRDHGLE